MTLIFQNQNLFFIIRLWLRAREKDRKVKKEDDKKVTKDESKNENNMQK